MAKLLEIEDLRTQFFTSAGTVRAVDGISYHVDEGKTALELLDQSPGVDMLFTDVVLPGGMNGRAVADVVRENFPDIKILFTSGYTENAIIHHGRLDEGVELLAKPYTQELLASRIREVLNGDTV